MSQLRKSLSPYGVRGLATTPYHSHQRCKWRERDAQLRPFSKSPPVFRGFSWCPPPQGKEGAGCDEPTSPPPPPPPPLPPPYSNTHPRPPNAPQGRKNGEGGEETGHGERDEQRRVTGQGRPRSPQTVQSAEGEEGKEKRERIILVVRSPCQENHPADAHPSALSAGVGKPSMDFECASGCTWSTAQATARLRDSRPWNSQTGQVIQGQR